MPLTRMRSTDEFQRLIAQIGKIPQVSETLQIILELPHTPGFPTMFDPLKYAIRIAPIQKIAQILASGACPIDLHLRIESDFNDLESIRILANALAHCPQNFTLDLMNTRMLPPASILNHTQQIAIEFANVLKQHRYQPGLSLHLNGVLQCLGDASHGAGIILNAIVEIPKHELGRMQLNAVTTGVHHIDFAIATHIQAARDWVMRFKRDFEYPMQEETARTEIQRHELFDRQLLRNKLERESKFLGWEKLNPSKILNDWELL